MVLSFAVVRVSGSSFRPMPASKAYRTVCWVCVVGGFVHYLAEGLNVSNHKLRTVVSVWRSSEWPSFLGGSVLAIFQRFFRHFASTPCEVCTSRGERNPLSSSFPLFSAFLLHGGDGS